jgi:hypothetical protein
MMLPRTRSDGISSRNQLNANGDNEMLLIIQTAQKLNKTAEAGEEQHEHFRLPTDVLEEFEKKIDFCNLAGLFTRK